MIPRAIAIAAFFLTAIAGFGADARSDRNCAICSRILGMGEKVVTWPVTPGPLRDAVKAGAFAPSQVCQNDDGHDKRAPAGDTFLWICSDCSNLYKRCAVCRLPIKNGGVSMTDNRWVCPLHADSIVSDTELASDAVILNNEMAVQIFEQARQAAVGLVGDYFALKMTSVSVGLTNFPAESGASQPRFYSVPRFFSDLEAPLHTLALSTTWTRGESIVSHSVASQKDLSKSEAFYALVHEYTHLWINENIGQHWIEKDTKEAICELVAYKVAEKRNDGRAQMRIRSNRYTSGRIHRLIEYAIKEPLYATLVWVSKGDSETLDAGVATATEVGSRDRLPLDVRIALAQQAGARSPQDEHQKVALNGMIHTPKGTLILLTGGLVLGKGESGLLKLNGEQERVRCVDIMTDSAVIQWENSTNALTLRLWKQ